MQECSQSTEWFWGIVALFVICNPVVPIRIGEPLVWALINFVTIYTLYRARLVFDRSAVVDKKTPEIQ